MKILLVLMMIAVPSCIKKEDGRTVLNAAKTLERIETGVEIMKVLLPIIAKVDNPVAQENGPKLAEALIIAQRWKFRLRDAVVAGDDGTGSVAVAELGNAIRDVIRIVRLFEPLEFWDSNWQTGLVVLQGLAKEFLAEVSFAVTDDPLPDLTQTDWVSLWAANLKR